MRRRLLPSLNALGAFEATARHGSVVHASEELNLSQSAVSRLVKQVEESLDVPLFARVKQRLILTEAGRAYAKAVHSTLTDLEVKTFRAMSYGRAEGSLSLGVFSTFAIKWLIPRLPTFTALRPKVMVSCFVRPTPFDFETDPLDAAIHYGIPSWPNAVAEPLFGEILIPVCSPRLAGARSIRKAKDILSFTLLHEVTRPLAWRNWFAVHSLEVAGTLQGPRFDQFGMVAAAAMAGLGVGLLPAFFVRQEIAAKTLIVPFSDAMPGEHMYHLVYPVRSSGMAAFEEFKKWIILEAGKEK
jgi:LysR family transcriptional regulator, glycine cleavage system transcriptional activator